MTKLVAALLAVLLPLASWASCTYATAGGSSTTVATCTTTTEAAPTLVTEGISLAGLAGLTVVVKSTGTMTAGGTFQAYLWELNSASWVRAPDLDLTAQALAGQAWPGFLITVPQGRLDYKPTGTGANTTTIYLIGASR